jgi:hypothetical protein
MKYTGAPERAVIAYEDAFGNPVDVSSANALPVTGGGGGGGGSLSDTVFVDSTGQLFVYRDTGSGTPNAYAIPAWTLYTPVGTVSSVYSNDPSTATAFGPVVAANTVLFTAQDTANEKMAIVQINGNFAGGVTLQASQDGTTYYNIQAYAFNNDNATNDTFYGPDTLYVPLGARFFRALTTTDFVGSVSGSYSLRTTDYDLPFTQATLVNNDPAYSVFVAAIDQNNYPTRIRANNFGQLILADNVRLVNGRMGLGTIVVADTTGYNSIVLQLTGTWVGTVTFQTSNDNGTWSSVVAWPVAGAAAPVNTATANGQWLIPTAGRFFRAQVTAWTSGLVSADMVLRNAAAIAPVSAPTIAANSSVNIAQIGATAPVTAGVAGMLAVGGNIAEDTAATSNPIIAGGVARTALPASTVVAGDAIRATYSVSGQMIIKEYAPADLDFFVNTTVTTNTQTQIRAAQASPIRTNVTNITFQNTNATATTLTIQDGATTLVTFSVPASMTLPVQLQFPTPLRGTAATALNYTAGTTGASVLLNVTGFSSY